MAPGDPALRPFQVTLRGLRLTNGLQLLLEPDASLPMVGVVEVVSGGAAKDPAGREGLANLLLQVSAHGQRERRDRAGIYSVEQTALFDETLSVSVAPREALPELMRLTFARLSDPLGGVEEADVDRERAIVATRQREQVETGARPALIALMQRRLFPEGHPYRTALAGTPDSLARVRLADLREAARSQYQPDHMTVLVFGDFDKAALGRALGEYLPEALARAPASPPPPPVPPLTKPPDPPGPKLERVQAALVSPELWVGWSLPPVPTPTVHELVADWMETELSHPGSPGEKADVEKDAKASARAPLENADLKRQIDTLVVAASRSPHALARLLSGLTELTDPTNAPLLAEDSDVLDVSTFTVSGRQGGLLVLRVRLRDGVHPEASLERVLNQLYRMWYPCAYYGGRLPCDSRRAENAHIGRALSTRFRVMVRLVLRATDTLDRVRFTAQRIAQGDDPHTVERSIEQVIDTSEGWMEHFAYDWLTRSRARALYLEPLPGAAPPGGPSLARLPVPAPPESAPAPLERSEVPVPAASAQPLSAWRTLRLPNGLEVVLVRRPEYPVVTVRLGLLHADSGVPGAIELAGEVAAPNSKWHGRPSSHGITTLEQISADLVAYEMQGAADALPRLLAQLGDRVRSMSVSGEALSEFRKHWLPLLEREDQRAESRADRAFWHALYPTRSFGQRVSWAQVGRVDAAAAAKWLREAYTPDRAVLAVVGELELDATQKLVEKWLGDWEPIEKPRRGEVRVYFNDRTKLEQPAPPPPPPPQPALLIEHRSSAEVVELRLACRVPNAERAAQARGYDLAAEVLADRLRHDLVDAGLAADLEGHAETLADGSAHLEVAGVLAARTLPRALERLQTAWDELGSGVLDPEAVTRARARLAGRVGLHFANPQRIAREVLDARKHGWPLDVLESYSRDVLDTQPAGLAAAFARCHDARVLSLVGDEPRIRAALRP